ncbi:MAG TPA: TetR/AcrR family transcriptional regulator [bacterium]|jgi:AcrR family transcriptional regulator|nr:TetR/AcrR family transcriptional regulator [bacterium]MDX9805777.1 TetR/AcrR family transcriptional regulator [bacterium]HNW15382.1 TetR/AcrR family transcriptional regulator [bacterium]HPM47284.1 TetR/AcrR family transcriptional regulator [bacterium]HPY14846.1 TetR/AcrR family transcriptional regulator [bacterium]
MKDSIRKRIIEKARDLLFTKTEEEITMNLIANELNITAPTLYHYFKGKDELLGAANQLITEEICAHLGIKFPPSIPSEMRIITATSMIAEYFVKTGLPVSYLVEDPKDRPIVLKEFRKKFTEMFSNYLKTKKPGSKVGAEQTTMRYLSILQADLAYIRNNKKELSEDFAEKVFSVLF